MYRVHLLEAAERELQGLDKSTARRIIARLNWLAENLDRLAPEALSGSLAGLYKLRVGDYRILYQLVRRERLIVVHGMGHRSRIYQAR